MGLACRPHVLCGWHSRKAGGGSRSQSPKQRGPGKAGPMARRQGAWLSPAALLPWLSPPRQGQTTLPPGGDITNRLSWNGSLVKQVQSQPLCTPSGLSWAIKHFKVTQHPATGPECSLLSPRHRRLGTDALGSPSAHGPVHFSPTGLRGRVSCCRTAVPPGSLLNSHCPKSPKWLCKGHTHRPPLFLAYRPTKPPGIKPDP